MSKWRYEEMAPHGREPGAAWVQYMLGPFDFVIDFDGQGISQAQVFHGDSGSPCYTGPKRRTLQAAHNDCKRYAKKLRAALVQFDRAKLP